MHILVDQDGVLAEWCGYLALRAVELYPHINFPFLTNNVNWDVAEGLDDEGRKALHTLIDLPEFYADLEPIPGAIQALHEMVAEGHLVTICTSPTTSNEMCASNKLSWVIKHLGKDWAKKVTITSDKTTVMGDILIDDKPEIIGEYEPVWEHVIFTAPYNEHVNDSRLRMNNWSEWRDIVNSVRV